MSRKFPILFLLGASALLAAPLALADCAKPTVKAPVMPQGATASEEEMREGHDKLQSYVKALEGYQACLEQQIKAAPADTKPEMKARWQAQADAAISAAQEIADVYSAQLRAYKSRD